jgi:D-alanine transaminase/branched-chain amino acid aminotransferase
MTSYAFFNGKIVPTGEANFNINDIGLLRGYGVFDFFRVINGRPIFLEDYLDRFERSVSGLNLILPYSRDFLREKIYELIALNQHPLLGIKLLCTGGYSEDGYTPAQANTGMIAKPFQFHPYENGLKLMLVDYIRELHHIKSINYLIPISQLPALNAIGADDVLYFKQDYISESSRSNIFIVKNGVLITPSEGILEGITRKKILAFAHEIMPIEVRPLSVSELKDADEVFLTASTKRISPVTGIDDQTYRSGPFTRQLFDRLLEEEVTS